MKSIALLKTISRIALVVVISLDGLAVSVRAQQRKIPKAPLLIVDASTRELIPEVLLLPRYSSFRGTSTLLGEGPGCGSNRSYLAKPFVYRSGTSFRLKLPRSPGFVLPGLLFIGTGKSLYGVLVVARGYRPLWFTSLWSVGSERTIKLTRISNEEWTSLLGETLGPLEKDVTRIEDNCSFWGEPSPCSLGVHLKKKEREVVRKFFYSHPSMR
jgi:hypothetical protein